MSAMTRTVANNNALTLETIAGYDSLDLGGDATRRTEPGIE
jgi:hypothetical protein